MGQVLAVVSIFVLLCKGAVCPFAYELLELLVVYGSLVAVVELHYFI